MLLHEETYDRLQYILESIELIEARIIEIFYAEDFVNSPQGLTIMDSVCMRLQSIGENVKKISFIQPETLTEADYDWEKIINFRDFISHHYEMLDYMIVYDICQNHLPQLKTIVKKYLTK